MTDHEFDERSRRAYETAKQLQREGIGYERLRKAIQGGDKEAASTYAQIKNRIVGADQ